MADIVTGTTTGQVNHSALHQDHADIRREGALNAADIRREVAQEACSVTDAVKTAGWQNSDRTGTEADRLANLQTQYFISAQQHDFTQASALAALKAGTDMQFQATQQAIQLAAEKNATATALASAKTDMLIVQEAQKGRDLARDQLIDELRHKCDRYEGFSRNWENSFYQAQQANVNSQIAALNSNLNETRQGVVNFGSMSGNAGKQTNTSNQI